MTNENQDIPESSGTKLWILFLALFTVFVTWACSGVILYPLAETARGTFGDMFGAVNSLFSGLAFAALIYTVFMQRDELSLQRKELTYTRNELQRSATAQEASEKALKAQAEAAAKSANLADVNALLTYYRGELEQYRKSQSYMGNAADRAEFARVLKCEKELVQILEATYQEITTEDAAKRQALSGTPTPPGP